MIVIQTLDGTEKYKIQKPSNWDWLKDSWSEAKRTSPTRFYIVISLITHQIVKWTFNAVRKEEAQAQQEKRRYLKKKERRLRTRLITNNTTVIWNFLKTNMLCNSFRGPGILGDRNHHSVAVIPITMTMTTTTITTTVMMMMMVVVVVRGQAWSMPRNTKTSPEQWS